MRLNPITASLALLLAASTALAAEDAPQCTQSPSQVSLERRLRQLYLDLLGRPPTMEEYRFTQMKGAILEEDIDALTRREAFYDRLAEDHRALLRSNISASINNNNDTQLYVGRAFEKPLELRSNPSATLRGRNNTGCNGFIQQDSCGAVVEDPHLEPSTKTCYDARGVPLPVSVDYSPGQYTFREITGIPAGAGHACERASTGGTIANPDGGARLPFEDKYLFYCDARRENPDNGQAYLADAGFRYFFAEPNAALKNQGLTTEVLDGDDRVIAYMNPAPTSGQTARLDRCTLNLVNNGGVTGDYRVQPGCIQREGWVMAPPPYWDPVNFTAGTPVKMCAIEAQARDTNPWTMQQCNTRFNGDRSCGCGVNATRCEGSGVHNQRVLAVNEEPLRIIDSVVRRDENYFNILTTRRGFVNGPLSQLYRNGQSPRVWVASAPTRADLVPDVPLPDRETWVEYTRDEHNAGVLTTAEWLYRFPTQRARVSQFWQSFLCKSFVPPANAEVPAPEDGCNRENNLAVRCGCKGCHATIEPVAAHWGRFGERNAQYLDPMRFPRLSAKCRDCALANNINCDNECGNYVMQAFDGNGAESLGLLSTYLYRTAAEEQNIEGGPRAMVEKFLQTGDLERCAVQNFWTQLLGRPMTTEEERIYLDKLVDEFARSNHNLRALMVRIASTDAYWRVD